MTNREQIDRWSYNVLHEASWDTTPVVDTMNALVSIARNHGPIAADTFAKITERINTAKSSDFDYREDAIRTLIENGVRESTLTDIGVRSNEIEKVRQS